MNKHVRNIILFFIISIISIITIMIFRLGFFEEVQIEQVQGQRFHLLFKQRLGPYHKIIKDLQFVEHWAKKNKIDCKTTFGEFLDNPDLTPIERLRANVGCVVQNKPEVELTDSIEFKVHSYDAFIKATFLGSPAIGPMKVYPKAISWAQEKNIEFAEGVLEVYRAKNDEMITEFYFPIKK
jgi:AraC family transcriptional regulator